MKNYYGKLLKLLFFKFRLEMEKVLLCFGMYFAEKKETKMKLHESRDVLKKLQWMYWQIC